VLIQIILLVAIAIIAVLLTRSTAGARHQAVRRLLLVGFVVLAVLSVLFPSWLTWLARLLGVGRGADLLLYALVIAFLSSLATTYRTTSLLNRRITVLARKVALAEAALAVQEERTSTSVEPSVEESSTEVPSGSAASRPAPAASGPVSPPAADATLEAGPTPDGAPHHDVATGRNATSGSSGAVAP
jgi:small membrane protein